jgi:hypothetical protein
VGRLASSSPRVGLPSAGNAQAHEGQGRSPMPRALPRSRSRRAATPQGNAHRRALEDGAQHHRPAGALSLPERRFPSRLSRKRTLNRCQARRLHSPTRHRPRRRGRPIPRRLLFGWVRERVTASRVFTDPPVRAPRHLLLRNRRRVRLLDGPGRREAARGRHRATIVKATQPPLGRG